MTEPTDPVGAVQEVAEGVVNGLVTFQLRLTQRHQIILHLLVDSPV